MKDREIVKLVNKEVDTLCKLLDVDCERDCDVEDGENDIKYIKVSFDGQDLGYMIGNRGRHLDSLQFILQVIVGRLLPEDMDFRVFVDVGGYRKDKDDRLEKMALQKAEEVRTTGEEVVLPPMKPSDRRIVHLTLQTYDDLSTESRGEGMDRHIVITPKSSE